MAKYFNFFPKTLYTSSTTSTGLDTVTNIISRFAFEKSLKENTSAFYKYDIQESDTPEIIAEKYYGNVERHWIVLLFNDIPDPQFDWPLRYETLITFIDTKYTSNGAANTPSGTGLSWAMNTNNVHSYYKIITRKSNDGTNIEEKIQLDANTYSNVVASNTSYTLPNGDVIFQVITKEKKTHYTYETEENEAKRTIKLLKPEFVSAVEKEFKKIIKL